jgi:hypothetical protein
MLSRFNISGRLFRVIIGLTHALVFMPILNASQTFDLINRRLHKPLSRAAFYKYVLPIMVEAGDATRLPKDTILDDAAAERWAAYMQAREAKIEAGEWSSKHAYTVADLRDLTS